VPTLATAAETRATALVTGAGRRIGRAIALDLAKHGWQIGVHYRSAEREARDVVREIEASGGRAVALCADLTSPAAIADLVPALQEKLGPVSCLVNNASVFIDDDLDTLSSGTWDQQLAVNLRAPVLLAQAFSRHLPQNLDGCIINLIDQRVLRPLPGLLSYAIAKEGLLAATRLLAIELAPRIRVNGIGPGPVLKNVNQTDTTFAREVAGTLLGHAVPTNEITEAVRFLLDARSVTGQMLALDSGQHLAPPMSQ
jgi:NAD(P)-dependent dehydrogenase (short-subunit alcohol dehydrogenase family)